MRNLLVLVVVWSLPWLLACAPEPWQRDLDVQAADQSCKEPDDGDRYACLERYAVETLNPDVCRLTGIWIDDMCLQALYEAAGDPAICDRLYLEGVRPTCRAYYAQRAIPMQRYLDPVLGFAAEVPSNWEISGRTDYVDPSSGRLHSYVEFHSELHAYGHEAFNRYGIRVAVGPSSGKTLTETVQLGLAPLASGFRDQVQVHCCLTVAGERAMELLNYPPTRWGSRQIVVLHDGRAYRVDVYPLAGMTTATPAGVEAQMAFETFLRTFAFIPISAAPSLPAPTVTPAPTPSAPAPGT